MMILPGLIETYCRMMGMPEPHQENKLQNFNQAKSEISGSFVLTHAHTRQFIDGISFWILNINRDVAGRKNGMFGGCYRQAVS